MSEHVYERHTPYSLSDWQKYLSHAEIDLLDSLAKSLPDNPRVCNVGSGAGTSALTFMSARPDLYLFTVEIVMSINLYGSIENEMGILKSAGLLDYSRYLAINQDSVVEGRRWQRGKLDLSFIDGGHTYEECKGDLDAWWPHLKLGGIMAIHDFKKRDAFARLHPEIEITDELMASTVKEYLGVDLATEELITSGKCEVITVVDTLIAVRKVSE